MTPLLERSGQGVPLIGQSLRGDINSESGVVGVDESQITGRRSYRCNYDSARRKARAAAAAYYLLAVVVESVLLPRARKHTHSEHQEPPLPETALCHVLFMLRRIHVNILYSVLVGASGRSSRAAT